MEGDQELVGEGRRFQTGVVKDVTRHSLISHLTDMGPEGHNRHSLPDFQVLGGGRTLPSLCNPEPLVIMERAHPRPQESWAQLPALPQPCALERVAFPPGKADQFSDLQNGRAWPGRL